MTYGIAAALAALALIALLTAAAWVSTRRALEAERALRVRLQLMEAAAQRDIAALERRRPRLMAAVPPARTPARVTAQPARRKGDSDV